MLHYALPQQEINGCKDGWQLILWQLHLGVSECPAEHIIVYF